MTPEVKEFLLGCDYGIAVEVDGELQEVVLFPEPPSLVDFTDIYAESMVEYRGKKIYVREAMDFEVSSIKKDFEDEPTEEETQDG